MVTNNASTIIGKYGDYLRFNDMLDELKNYNRVLTDAEINLKYQEVQNSEHLDGN